MRKKIEKMVRNNKRDNKNNTAASLSSSTVTVKASGDGHHHAITSTNDNESSSSSSPARSSLSQENHDNNNSNSGGAFSEAVIARQQQQEVIVEGELSAAADDNNNDEASSSSSSINSPQQATAAAQEDVGHDRTAAAPIATTTLSSTSATTTESSAASSSPGTTTSDSRKKKKSSTGSVIKQQQQQQQQQRNGIKNTRRRRKRRRIARVACVHEENDNNNNSRGVVKLTQPKSSKTRQSTTTTTASLSTTSSNNRLPEFQYETTLTRRAIRKWNHGNDDDPALLDLRDDDTGAEIYGDTSLGMKLGIVAGHVIVQGCNALWDGRASPAQLSGMIHRGDVLLEINGQSLVHVAGDQLLGRLKPLSEPTVVVVMDHTTNTPTKPSGSSLATAQWSPSYQRHVHLRFSSGQGLEILRKSSEHAAARAIGGSGSDSSGSPLPSTLASEVFSLFPMADQLSGMPLFEDLAHITTKQQQQQQQQQAPPPSPEQEQASLLSTGISSSPHRSNNKQQQRTLRRHAVDDDISRILAYQRSLERKTYASEFFDWSDDQPTLLRTQPDKNVITSSASSNALDMEESKLSEQQEPHHDNSLTHVELLELGRKAVRGAKMLSMIMERVDRGSDRRSLHSLSATLSLYSRASARRRYVLDSQAMPINIEKVEEDSKEESSNDGSDDDVGSSNAAGGSGGSDGGSDEGLDGDELLLRLAARDEIWRQQVIEFLEKVIQEAKDDAMENEDTKQAAADDIDAALANEFGNFLFGENMSKVLNKHKKPQALPPEEITALLFDLTTKVSATVPDQIKTATGGSTHMSQLSSLVPFTGMKRQPADSDVMLATRYLLDEILPVWLKTFRPLPWDQRRVLWPLDKAAWSAESTAESTISDDSLTADNDSANNNNARSSGLSMAMTAATPGTRFTSPRKTKNLREQIEDIELNVETRSETCFLTTFYFTQQLLPRLTKHEGDEVTEKDENGTDRSPDRSKDSDTCSIVDRHVQEAVVFVKEYGAYLKMQTCLSYAAVLKAQPVIDRLLDVAKYDPRHREVSKHFGKNSLVFYDPTMLSAIVQRLQDIRRETNVDRRRITIELCAAAYPDVRPWQVERQCRHATTTDSGTPSDALDELYYIYLSMLLHPRDGHDAARHDPALVKEWCELSVVAPASGGSSKGSPRGKTDKTTKEQQRRKNFLSVASRASSDHLTYHRDLELLLELSMQMDELDLSLDLSAELLEDSASLDKDGIIDSVVLHLRRIGCAALDMAAMDERSGGMRILKRIIRLYNKASTTSSTPLATTQRVSIDVPNELLQLLEHVQKQAESGDGVKAIDKGNLVRFLSQHAVPVDLLETLSRWFAQYPEDDSNSDLYPVLQTILQRGLQASPDNELSGSLLRLRQARARLQKRQPSSDGVNSGTRNSPMEGQGMVVSNNAGRDLWKNLGRGMLVIAK